MISLRIHIEGQTITMFSGSPPFLQIRHMNYAIAWQIRVDILSIPISPNPLMLVLPEPKNYTNLWDIYSDVLSNPTLISIAIIGIVGFLLLQKLGETVHTKLVSSNRRRTVSKQLFGTYFQSTFHAAGISLVSFVVLFQFINRNAYLLTIDQTDDGYFYVEHFKICTTLSTSYFLVSIPYELFVIKQRWIKRVAMSVHHLLGVFALPIIPVSHPIFVLVGALTYQCEISTVFLNMRLFGMAMESQYVYCIGGIGTLITYPLTRIVFYMYTIHTTYSLMDTFVDHVGIGAFYLVISGQVFVLCLSTKYTFELWRHPKKTAFLNTRKRRYVLVPQVDPSPFDVQPNEAIQMEDFQIV